MPVFCVHQEDDMDIVPAGTMQEQMELFVSILKSTCRRVYRSGDGDSFLLKHHGAGIKHASISYKPASSWQLALASAFLLQGCVTDLGGLPGTSFNAPSRESAVGEDKGRPDVHPLKATLAEDTIELLDRYAYAQQVQPPAPRAKRSPGDRAVAGLPSPQDLSEQKFLNQGEPSLSSFTIEAVDAPVQAMLFSLAYDARMQLRVNGQLDASVTINAVNQSLEDIMDSLARQAGFSWQQDLGVLTVWGGQTYAMSYPIDYLNIHRRTQSSVGLATQVGTINASGGDTGSIANSSQTRVENTSEHHFWDSLLADVQSIVTQVPTGDTTAEADFSINREAGLLSLYALPEVHRNLQSYLKQLHGSTQRQVLIEATVVEVALSESFEAGVDWQVLANGISGVNAAQVLLGAPLLAADTINRVAAPAGLVSLVHQGSNGDMRATLSLLEQFGDVRILSRPRIIALNNQSSVLKVVDNRVYFTVNVQRRQTEERDEIVTETEIHTVPVGLVMNVTPYISKRGSVMLNVRPTLSRILGFVNDPNPELALANVRNGVPEIQVREMESMLQVNSGEVAIIGGLMQETHSENDARLPGLGMLPGIGRLFSKNSRARRQTELLIVLRPTVLDSTPSAAYP